MFQHLQHIHERPAPFGVYTAADLWNDAHTSSRMLAYHLDGSVDVSSRRTAFIDRSVAWIAGRFNVTAHTSIADLGCGPGLYSTRFARLGARVSGVDFSDRSISYAKQQADDQGLSVDYVCGNYLDFQPPRTFDLVTLIMCDFCALSPAQRRRLLTNIRGYLAPGGSFLFDVYSLRSFHERVEQTSCAPNLLDGFWSNQPYFGFLNTFKYHAERVVLDKYTIVEEARTRVIYNWFQYYDAGSLERELGDAGFRVTERLGTVSGDPFDEHLHEFAVVAQANDAAR